MVQKREEEAESQGVILSGAEKLKDSWLRRRMKWRSRRTCCTWPEINQLQRESDPDGGMGGGPRQGEGGRVKVMRKK